MKRAVLAAFLVLATTTAHGQAQGDFEPFSLVPGAPNVILLDGVIDFRTPLAFRRILEANPTTSLLALNSVGGSVQPALLVAEEIHERGINTLIIPEAQCLSACSYLYFAGRERVVLGKLGVHQMHGDGDMQSTQLNLSDVLQVLGKYEVSAEVITKMLRTPPDQMYVFSQHEIVSLGINRFKTEPGGEHEEEEEGVKPVVRQAPPEELAKAFVLGVIASGSLKGGELVSMAEQVYAETVIFYGKTLTRPEVLADKTQYAKRWPLRWSSARPTTIVTNCGPMHCRVTGVYDWRVSDPKSRKSLKGSATFDYEVEMGAAMRITSENGEVLYRALGD